MPITFDAALYNRTTTFDNAGSPPSCCPLAFASTHVKSPSAARRNRPASKVRFVWWLVSVMAAVRPETTSASLSIAVLAPACRAVNS